MVSGAQPTSPGDDPVLKIKVNIDSGRGIGRETILRISAKTGISYTEVRSAADE